jgi:hypothetical protein
MLKIDLHVKGPMLTMAIRQQHPAITKFLAEQYGSWRSKTTGFTISSANSPQIAPDQARIWLMGNTTKHTAHYEFQTKDRAIKYANAIKAAVEEFLDFFNNEWSDDSTADALRDILRPARVR